MNERGGSPSVLVMSIDEPFTHLALEEIRYNTLINWDRYDNPFEQKWALRDKWGLPDGLGHCVSALEGLVGLASQVCGVELAQDDRHYAGVFRYAKGDHLSAHCDAGIHPVMGVRKHATALLYLGNGGGDLEFWSGSSIASAKPEVHYQTMNITPRHGMVVLFENTDYAWHSVMMNNREDDRIVVTVSFMNDPKVERKHFTNTRQRAYFAPRPYEHWYGETLRLRDLRADSERYAEAYRT